jgi:hypothetical protein
MRDGLSVLGHRDAFVRHVIERKGEKEGEKEEKRDREGEKEGEKGRKGTA